jgi:DNA (cytosine-5)-methyltransferase 1
MCLEEDVDDKYFLSEKMVDGFTKHNENHNEKKTGFIFEPKNENDIANCLRANAALCPTDNTIKIELCKYSFHTCGNLKYDLCDTCDNGDNYEYLQNDNTSGIRRLTPRECFRLMDFPDTFTWPVSDSQAYKQAGNSIVVNVLYKILKNLLK